MADDGGYIAVIREAAAGFGLARPEVGIVKVDSNGRVEWRELYGNRYDIHGVANTPDGGYMLTGRLQVEQGVLIEHPSGAVEWIGDDSDIFMLRVDEFGHIVE